MASWSEAEYNMFRDRFFRLPRELRDLVYANVYTNSAPVDMGTIDANPTSMALLTSQGRQVDPEHAVEALEAFYTHKTFNVTFPDSDITTRARPVPLSPHPQCHKYIRTLDVYAQEADISPDISLYRAIEHGYKDGTFLRRTPWENLLELPRLERLTIYLQKRHVLHFSWADFSPVLIELRKRLPKLRLAFKISFDTLLERYWTDPIWENYTEPGNVIGLPYDPMGFVDVSELITAPTEEDVQYVQEYCSEQQGSSGRDILTGLLDETAPQRRALALHYVVREPSLLRVRMMEDYEACKETMRAGADMG